MSTKAGAIHRSELTSVLRWPSLLSTLSGRSPQGNEVNRRTTSGRKASVRADHGSALAKLREPHVECRGPPLRAVRFTWGLGSALRSPPTPKNRMCTLMNMRSCVIVAAIAIAAAIICPNAQAWTFHAEHPQKELAIRIASDLGIDPSVGLTALRNGSGREAEIARALIRNAAEKRLSTLPDRLGPTAQVGVNLIVYLLAATHSDRFFPLQSLDLQAEYTRMLVIATSTTPLIEEALEGCADPVAALFNAEYPKIMRIETKALAVEARERDVRLCP